MTPVENRFILKETDTDNKIKSSIEAQDKVIVSDLMQDYFYIMSYSDLDGFNGLDLDKLKNEIIDRWNQIGKQLGFIDTFSSLRVISDIVKSSMPDPLLVPPIKIYKVTLQDLTSTVIRAAEELGTDIDISVMTEQAKLTLKPVKIRG